MSRGLFYIVLGIRKRIFFAILFKERKINYTIGIIGFFSSFIHSFSFTLICEWWKVTAEDDDWLQNFYLLKLLFVYKASSPGKYCPSNFYTWFNLITCRNMNSEVDCSVVYCTDLLNLSISAYDAFENHCQWHWNQFEFEGWC